MRIDKMAIAAKAFSKAVDGMGSATIGDLAKLYASSFMYTTCTIFQDDPDKLTEAMQFFKDYINDIDPKEVAEILKSEAWRR